MRPDGIAALAPEGSVVIRPLAVEADGVAVSRFARALGLAEPGAGGSVPWTYPITWMTLEPVRRALVELAGPGRAPVHVGQEIVYSRPVEFGGRYALTVVLAPEANAPERIKVQGEVLAPEGGAVCRLAATLVLVDAGGPAPP